MWDSGQKQGARQKVVISRHWHSPEISVTVSAEKIELTCDLEDFVAALVTEMPHPLKMWSRKKHSNEANAAMLRAIEKIKESSSKVM